MKRFFVSVISLLASLSAFTQFVYKVKADSVLITNDSCSAEFNLENSTRNVHGFLFNKGNGRTEFKRGVSKINDSLYLIGGDTLNVAGKVASVGVTTGTSGADINISGSPITGTGTITLNIPIADGTHTGKLSSSNWTTFNNKGSGTITSISTSNGVSGGVITGIGTISGINAAADGSTKGVSSFNANDFDASSGNISIDYSNGQAASNSNNGFMKSIDYKRDFTSQTLTPPSGSWAFDANAGGQADVAFSATGGRTLSFSNIRAGDIILVRSNNTSGSSITITLPSNSFVDGSSSSTLIVPTGRSVMSLLGYDGTNYLFSSPSGLYATSLNNLGVFASTTSSQFAGVISDETGSGPLVFGTSASLTTPNIGAATGASLTATGAIKSSSSSTGIGYATGAGGTVTQITSKVTGVTLNKISGQITMINSALAAGTAAKFTVTNSSVAATDVVVASIQSVGTSGSYLVSVSAVGSGSFDITVDNISAGSLSQAVVINFVVIKGVNN